MERPLPHKTVDLASLGRCDSLAQIQRSDFTARGGGEHTLASLAVLTGLLAVEVRWLGFEPRL